MVQKRIALLVFLVSAFLGVNWRQVATAQSLQDASASRINDVGTLQALLEEVRLLRNALERTNRQAYLMQLAVDSARRQQQRVDQLEQRLENAQNEMAIWQLSQPHHDERLKEIENSIESETDEKGLRQLKSDYKETQRKAEEQTRRLNQLREREAHLTNELQVERNKLDRVNERLSKLENELERPNSKPQGNP